MGHTMSIHSQNDAIVLEFGLKKPAFRIVVNSPTTHGSIGLTTGLDPAMTLGCGGYGGNITSDNISPRHLLNIKRLAYEITPAANQLTNRAAAMGRPYQTGVGADQRVGSGARVSTVGISADALNRRIDEFLGSRGYKPPPASSSSWGPASAGPGGPPDPPERFRQSHGGPPKPEAEGGSHWEAATPPATPAVLDFVCEDDVRQAVQAGRKLLVSERAIITPAARELGEQHRVFTVSALKG